MSLLKPFLALVVLGAAGLLLFGAIDDDDRPTSSQTRVSPKQVALSEAQKEELQAAVLNDPTVRAIAGTSQVSPSITYPWTTEGANMVRGAVVEVSLQPPVVLSDQRIPVVFTPGPKASTQAPDLYRTVVLSASNVNRLEASVELDGSRVVEVMPIGTSRITAGKLLGSPLTAAYTDRGD